MSETKPGGAIVKKKMKAVTFSYDDGVESDIKLLEIFNKYNVKCTFNLNSGRQYGDSVWRYKDAFDVRRLDKAEKLAELYKGHEIAIHGAKHIHPTDLTETQLEEEFLTDKQELEKYFDCEIKGMAYAFGQYDDNTVDYLKRIGLKYGRTTKSNHSFDLQSDLMRFEPTCHHEDGELMSLCEKFIKSEPNKPQIFYIWGHSYEFDANNNFYIIDKLCKELSKYDVYFGTNSEVFEYFNLL